MKRHSTLETIVRVIRAVAPSHALLLKDAAMGSEDGGGREAEDVKEEEEVNAAEDEESKEAEELVPVTEPVVLVLPAVPVVPVVPVVVPVVPVLAAVVDTAALSSVHQYVTLMRVMFSCRERGLAGDVRSSSNPHAPSKKHVRKHTCSEKLHRNRGF